MPLLGAILQMAAHKSRVDEEKRLVTQFTWVIDKLHSPRCKWFPGLWRHIANSYLFYHPSVSPGPSTINLCDHQSALILMIALTHVQDCIWPFWTSRGWTSSSIWEKGNENKILKPTCILQPHDVHFHNQFNAHIALSPYKTQGNHVQKTILGSFNHWLGDRTTQRSCFETQLHAKSRDKIHSLM